MYKDRESCIEKGIGFNFGTVGLFLLFFRTDFFLQARPRG